MNDLPAYLASLGVPVPVHRPWPRHVLDLDGWIALIGRLAVEDWALIGLWAEPGCIHAALRDDRSGSVAVASLHCPDGRFPALSVERPGAIRLERAIQDLFGLRAEGLADPRPWLDHDVWTERHPLSAAPAGLLPKPAPYDFLPVEGAGLHRVPVGPVHAGIIEPGHFRFTANGETVVRLEQRLGYVHKGVERLMAGKTVAAAAKLAARVSGDSTVAYGLAFARAVEEARGVEVPERAVWLRALMAEMERLANHIGDIGAICNDAAFTLMATECGMLRERILRAADACFGHRLMMDCVVPGGVSTDLPEAGGRLLNELFADLGRQFAGLVTLYDTTASLLDRTTGTGIADADPVRRFGAGGFVGRASGRALDARRHPGYPPYDRLAFDIPVLTEGDVNARIRIRIREVEQSLRLVGQILDALRPGDIRVTVETGGGEGMALVEGFRGEILMWVRLSEDGLVERCHPRDPSWFQWPLLEAAVNGTVIADFPLCNKSFNCSYSGHDL